MTQMTFTRKIISRDYHFIACSRLKLVAKLILFLAYHFLCLIMCVDLCFAVLLIALLLFLMNPHFTYSSATYGGKLMVMHNHSRVTFTKDKKLLGLWSQEVAKQIYSSFQLPLAVSFKLYKPLQKRKGVTLYMK